MACNSCIKENYDFILKEIDCNAFLYQDTSTWMSGTSFCKPETYKVALYPPGNTDPVYINLATGLIGNKVTSDVLEPTGLSKFKDGVYYFAVDANAENNGYCGIEFRKSVAIIPSLQCCFDKAFLKYALFRKDEIKHIEFLVRSVRLNALVGNIEASEEYYDLAKNALKKLDCDCSY